MLKNKTKQVWWGFYIHTEDCIEHTIRSDSVIFNEYVEHILLKLLKNI